ncbi:hypothetical protein JXVLWARM_CDS_0067 [Burkholderia phage Bm1]
MTEAAQATQSKTRIQLPTTSMVRVKSVSGGVSFHCGDDVATKLHGLPLEQVKAIAATVGIDVTKYDHLNQGQQRMNIGNMLRSFVRKNPDEAETFYDAAAGVRAAYEAETAEQRAADEAAAAQKAADKEAAAKKRAEAKEAREAAKAKREADKLEAAQKREAKKAEREAEAERKKKEKAEKEAAKAAAKKAE